jgi:hypothetical protein
MATVTIGTTSCSLPDDDVAGQQPAARGSGEPASRQSSREVQDEATGQRLAAFGQEREETWMSCEINGTKIGYSHTVVEPVARQGVEYLRFRNQQELKIRRFGTDTVIRTDLTSLETEDGQVVELRSELDAGGEVMATEGRFADGQLQLRNTSQGKVETTSIPFRREYGGFFSDQRSLRKKPMIPRETRRLKAFQPLVNQVGEIRLEAVSYEATKLPSGSRQLLRIDMTVDMGAAQLKSILWTDQDGTVCKLRDLQLGMEAYLTSKEDAQAASQGGDFDLGSETIVRIDQPIEDPHRTKQIVYRASLQEGKIEKLLMDGGSQRVSPVDDRTVQLTVRAVRPGDPADLETPPSDRPQAVDLEATTMLQSDDPEVVKMAGLVAPDETDSWRLACDLERYVKGTIQLKNYSTAMATAAEVARTREGDCTEHAMLLAALCRVRKIPARVAIGLVYYAPVQGFAYHMWTEVWIKDRWVPMDATLGLGGIGAAHVKLSHSSLKGSSAFAELLPVIQAIGRLELKVVSVK